MHEKTHWIAALLCSVVCGLGMSTLAAAGSLVAGVQPHQRPDGAPVLSPMKKDAAWYMQALTGVSEPYPDSLRFLANQGNWYTPFNRPGMTAPYDIRGWHTR